MSKWLTNSEEKFCNLVIAGKSRVDAYREAYPDTPHHKASSGATVLMKQKHILGRMMELRNAVARAAIMTGAKVVDEWTKIALADVNEIIQYQRVNCHHCHGAGGAYQWGSMGEYSRALAKAIDLKQEPPGCEGGFGFRFNANPNPDCIKCFGEGEERIYIADSRNLSDSALALYMGVKQGKYGPEVILRDKDAALANLARYFKLIGNNNMNIDSDGSVNINIVGGFEI